MTIEERFAEYAAFHQDPVNRAAHVAGLPLIAVGAIGLLSAMHPLAALAFTALIGASAFRVHVPLACALVAVLVPLHLVGATLPAIAAGALLAIGVAIPVTGHVAFERRWPDSAARLARFEAIGHLWFLDRSLGLVPEDPVLVRKFDPLTGTYRP